MYSMILFFILTQLAIGARYLVYGAFHVWGYISTYAFLGAAIFIYCLGRYMAKKETIALPTYSENWTFSIRQHVFLNKKALYYNGRQQGFIQHIFQHRWQYVIADIFSNRFFLSLRIHINHDVFDVCLMKQTWLTDCQQWSINQNDCVIGTIYNVREGMTFKESLHIEIGNTRYTTTSIKKSDCITIHDSTGQIGILYKDPLHTHVQVIEAPVDASISIVALLLHTSYFEK